MSLYNYLAELAIHDGSITQTLRYSTRGHVTGPGETPADTFYDPRIVQPAIIGRRLFENGRTFGRSKSVLGDLELTNVDGGLDALIGYGFDGRAITIRRGLPGAAYPAGFPLLLMTTMEQAEISKPRVIVRLRDRQAETEVPLQETKFDGDNVPPDGLEGGEELKDKPKPICYGSVVNVTPAPVNPYKLIYQVNDGAIASVVAYDNGIPLSNGYDDWHDQLDPFGADTCWCIRNNGTMHVAVGTSGKLLTSTDDGASWTSRTSSFAGTDTIRGVVWSYDLDLWIAVGHSAALAGKIATSPDGITWTQRTVAGSPTELYDVAAANGLVVVVGVDGAPYIATSTNGTAWTQRTEPASFGTPFAVAYGASQWVIGGSGEVATSPDAITWTAHDLPAGAGGVSCLLFSQPVWYCGTFLGELFASFDAITWSTRTTPMSNHLYKIAETQQGLIAVGADNTIATLPFGAADWTLRTVSGVGATEDITSVSVDSDVVIIGTLDGQTFTAERGTTYASEADLLDDSLAPKPGTIGVYAAGGKFRLGAPLAGQLTADVVQGAAASNRTAGQIWKLILERIGMVSGTDFSASDITTLDTANSAVIGFYADHEMTAAEALDQVASTVGAAWWADKSGVFRIKRIVAPSGSAVISFTEHDIARDTLEREPTRDPGRGLPVWRTILRYAKNYTPQTSGLAGGVSAARRAELAMPWRETKDEDSAVKTKHLLAPEVIEETLFASKADADTEADRRQTLRGTRRDFFTFDVQLNTDTDDLELCDVIEIVHSRFGLSAGKKFLLLSIEHDLKNEVLTLGAWG